MRKLFIYALVGLSLGGCDSSRESEAAAGTGAVEHERTLRYSKADDGSTVIQAIRITNGQRAIDTAAGKDAVQSRGIHESDRLQGLWPGELCQHRAWRGCCSRHPYRAWDDC